MIKPYTSEDYMLFASWMVGHNFPPPPAASLPPTGAISYTAAGVPAAMSFLYKTDSSFALIEWTVRNPEVERSESEGALTEVLEFLQNKAKDDGYDILFTSLSNKRLGSRLERLGWQKTDTGMTNYTRRL